MTDLTEIAALLVAHAPRQQAQNTLGLLVARTRAKAGTLLRLKDDVPSVFASSKDPSVEAIVRACAVWDRNRVQLEQGHHALVGTDLVVPVRGSRGTMEGLAYLDAPASFEATSLSTFCYTFVKAFEAESMGVAAVAAGLAELPQHGREQLLTVLENNEWNIARVARQLGVTRRTIYLRMARYGITRERMPRTNAPSRRRQLPVVG